MLMKTLSWVFITLHDANKVKTVAFLTGTRADFGKLTSLISALEAKSGFVPKIFVTGMHLEQKFGETWREVSRAHSCEIEFFANSGETDSLAMVLGKTVVGFSEYISKHQPDLVIVHGDRTEALAGASAGALSGIRVGHVEGGERSGTIDETLRHAITKLSHLHFVNSDDARKHVIGLGERAETVFDIGSPDFDVLLSNRKPIFEEVADHYGIDFPKRDYGICIFHPVFFEQEDTRTQISELTKALLASDKNYVVILPNNDPGHQEIIDAYEAFRENARFRVFPSIRFEYFGTLLENCILIVGNSSAGIYEAPQVGVRSINVGSRQSNRLSAKSVLNVSPSASEIRTAIERVWKSAPPEPELTRGTGDSAERFLEVLATDFIWNIPLDKSLPL